MSVSDYEQRLVFAARNGNERCFEELYKRYYQKVYLLAKSTLKNEADAEDVLQQTFISAWRNLPGLEDIGAFNTWLQRITLNQCYSLLRRNKPVISADEEDEDGRSSIADLESDLMLPEVYAQQEDLKERLGRIISQLSDVQRQTVQLYYFDEMTVEEIAAVMDCSVGTVKSRLYLARNAIRTEIEEIEQKTGTKFYGVAGLPLLSLRRLFVSQAEAASMPLSSAAGAYSEITAELFGTAKSLLSEAAEAGLNRAGKAAAKSAAKKTVASAAKGIGSRIIAAAVSAGILCGSIAGGFSDVSAAKVAVPDGGLETVIESSMSNSKSSSAENLSSVYRAYAELLEQEKEYIDLYTWQKGYYGSTREKPEYTRENEPKPVVLADIYGDELPELVYVSGYVSEETPNACYCTDLHIVTYRDGAAIELYCRSWDYNVAGGFHYCLFQRSADKALYAFESYGDEYWINEYVRFAEEDGVLVEKDDLKYDRHPDYDNIVDGYLNSIDKYTLDDVEISENDYLSLQKELTDSTSTVLMYSSYISEDMRAFAAEHGCPAMTCDEAIFYLQERSGQPFAVQPEDIPASLTRFFDQFNFGYGGDFDAEADSSAFTAQYNLMDRIMANGSCCDSHLYPGKSCVEHWEDGTADPQGRYTDNGGSYMEFDIAQAKWIAKNILNQSEDRIETLLADGEKNGLYYIQDGTVYLPLGGVGGPAHIITYLSAAFDGTRLEVVYSDQIEGFPDTMRYFRAVVTYKEIDGCCYWSLYRQTVISADEAIRLPDIDENDLFDYLNGIQFTFTSGIGGWGTELTVCADGSFSGSYSDCEYGIYTVYFSEFAGKFSDPRKINNYTLAVTLTEFTTQDAPGTEYYDEADGLTYIATEPYGITGGTTFYFYLPGAPVSALPESYVDWTRYMISYKGDGIYLPFWGLYNEEECNGFYSDEASIEPRSGRVVTVPVRFTGDKTVDLNWGWDLFNKDASEYDHDLAMAGLVLSQAAELGEGEIKARYQALGFENTQTVYYSGREDNMNMPASCFASSEVNSEDGPVYFVSVAVRGTADFGDVLTDLGSVTDGFNGAANRIKEDFKSYYSTLSDYYGKEVTPDNTVLFITGHSLGAAVAGQLGQMLEGSCGRRSKMFVYTFASPNYQTFAYDTEAYTNIHNILNIKDIVPEVPFGFKKYGHSWYYDASENGVAGILANHICETYLDCMLRSLPANMGDGAGTAYSLSSVHCPVDIQVLDRDGKLTAWTVGEQVHYADGAELLVVTDGEEKYVYAPAGVAYNLVFVGTGDGTMQYVQQSVSGGEVICEQTFDAVKIEPEKLLYAQVDPANASAQALQVIDRAGHIRRNVQPSGKEAKPLFSFSAFGWVLFGLDVISAVALVFSILSVIRLKKKSAVLVPS